MAHMPKDVADAARGGHTRTWLMVSSNHWALIADRMQVIRMLRAERFPPGTFPAADVYGEGRFCQQPGAPGSSSQV